MKKTSRLQEELQSPDQTHLGLEPSEGTSPSPTPADSRFHPLVRSTKSAELRPLYAHLRTELFGKEARKSKVHINH